MSVVPSRSRLHGLAVGAFVTAPAPVLRTFHQLMWMIAAGDRDRIGRVERLYLETERGLGNLLHYV